MANSELSKNISLTELITTLIKTPGIKVSRKDFLSDQFKNVSPEQFSVIIEKGPVEAGYSKEQLRNIAKSLLHARTSASAMASFAAGLPGGVAMAATMPADLIQFYGIALRTAQEISYLYGEPDLWENGVPNDVKVTDQLILYIGVMFGASGAAQTVKVMSSSLAKHALKSLPQKALTKTFYYPIVKSIAKSFGAKMTKDIFAKGVSNAVPVIGGIFSGGITIASMLPMGNRLIDTLEDVRFGYSMENFNNDWNDIMEECEKDDFIVAEVIDDDVKFKPDNILEKINQAKQMLDCGVLTDDEFAEIKKKLISQM